MVPGCSKKLPVARVGAIAQVGNILLGKNIAVRAILGDVGVLFADGGFGAIGAGTVGGLQATGNTRRVAVSAFQRAIVQPQEVTRTWGILPSGKSVIFSAQPWRE